MPEPYVANKELIWALPKAELHLHLEGTLEPEMMMTMATRNSIPIKYATVDEVRAAYVFKDLQSFLDVYYAGCSVLVEEQDFYDLTIAYLQHAAAQGVCHAEVFFDPQSHTSRGVPFETVIRGIHSALAEYESRFRFTSRLILCFLRHLSDEDAFAVLDAATPYLEWISAVGLDSSEAGNPPSKFAAVFDRARGMGLLTVAHAGEEGSPEYIWQALEILHAVRIDHGVKCLDDERLVARLASEQTTLTVCPLSNVKLHVFASLAKDNLPALLDHGLRVTINSDDPAYFGGYIADNFLAVAEAFRLTDGQIVQLVRNSVLGSFLSEEEKEAHMTRIDALVFNTVTAPQSDR
ncbi:MAG: adenosine deaminase [Acidimicrobiales bacterium]|jgi:adenosine deaminase